ELQWSAHFRERHAGQPVKAVVLRHGTLERTGEFVISDYGAEGSGIYALSASLRVAIERDGQTLFQLELLPQLTQESLVRQIAHPRGSRSMSSHLRSRIGLEGVKAGLLRECAPPETYNDPVALAHAIKSLPLRLLAPRPIDEAISSAGGVRFEALDE